MTEHIKITYRNIVCNVIILLFSLLLSSCSEEPVLLGFSGTLSGRYSDLSVQGRNGAMLAVEDINSNGGINGRKLKLLAANDKNTEAETIKADQKLIDAGVDVIIGHMSSTLSFAAINKFKNTVYISPISSSDELQGIKDNFFRVIPSFSEGAKFLASYAYNKIGCRRLAVMMDKTNHDYTESYKNIFTREFIDSGGEVAGTVEYYLNPSSPIDWKGIVADLATLNPDSVIAITSSRDLAAFAQFCRLEKKDWTILSSMWGFTKELIQIGGKSVDGIYFSVNVERDCPDLKYKCFKKRYEERFGAEPNFAARFGYEAVFVFAEAYKKNGESSRSLEKVLPGMEFKVLDSEFKINEFGDVERAGHVVTIKGGQFEGIEGTSGEAR
ncbi:ABC transporter substrate-binding protein [Maridesulfovibrio bastinii]|uniref:ABC transporter substrate-binding protein n=1 Tax=Maridesulfovibrio bastinii TaxID=47157 RepID=UPI0003FE4ECF|nr:ABC transporter substrate-binding protein [Maridesulfovibrio bastinii]